MLFGNNLCPPYPECFDDYITSNSNYNGTHTFDSDTSPMNECIYPPQYNPGDEGVFGSTLIEKYDPSGPDLTNYIVVDSYYRSIQLWSSNAPYKQFDECGESLAGQVGIGWCNQNDTNDASGYIDGYYENPYDQDYYELDKSLKQCCRYLNNEQFNWQDYVPSYRPDCSSHDNWDVIDCYIPAPETFSCGVFDGEEILIPFPPSTEEIWANTPG